MPKNIVIFCDGTGNSFDNAETESNVSKLYSCIMTHKDQICYYHPGVGTMGSPKARGTLGKQWSRLMGLAFGAGLLANVSDAYRYLMDNYDDGDRIFLFGFSRGSFTVRVLASLLHVYGLLCAGNHELIPYIVRMYQKQSRKAKHMLPTFKPDDAFKWQFARRKEVRIHFCGIWDTVSSYGWIYSPIKLPFIGVNPILDIGRHAVSIHERRCFYQDNLWGEEPGKNIRQVWFAGVHSDVGGSYEEAESGLSKIALEWMLIEATRARLEIDQSRAENVLGMAEPEPPVKGLPKFAQPDQNAKLHHSLHGVWWALELLPLQDPHRNGRGWWPHLGRYRQIPDGSLIHESVLKSKWKPEDLPPHRVEPWERYPLARAMRG